MTVAVAVAVIQPTAELLHGQHDDKAKGDGNAHLPVRQVRMGVGVFVFVPMSICCVLVPMNLSRAVLMAVALRVICCTQCYCGCGGVLDRAVLVGLLPLTLHSLEPHVQALWHNDDQRGAKQQARSKQRDLSHPSPADVRSHGQQRQRMCVCVSECECVCVCV